MGYYSGTANTQDALLQVIETAVLAAGWTVDRTGAVGAGGLAGRELLVHKGDVYVQLRSMADLFAYLTAGGFSKYAGPCVFLKASTGYDGGEDWDTQPGTWTTQVGGSGWRAMYIGTTQLETAVAAVHTPDWPAVYRIFTFTNPDLVLCVLQTGPARYQWLMFGMLEKFGTWTGGTLAGATNCANVTTSNNGSFANLPIFSIGGASRARSYAPFHNMEVSFNRGLSAYDVTNSTVLMDVGSEGPMWSTNGANDPFDTGVFYRHGYGNALTTPINSRSPNTFNQVGVMTPLWVYTQRDTQPNYAVVGRVPHVRQMPLANFDPEDTFLLGSDKWMVFPYFERGGATGLWGWAVDANEVP